MFNYPARVTFDDDSGAYEISFRDFKNLHSVAYSEDDIPFEATDGLTASIYDHISSRVPIPEPSVIEDGEILIHLPALTCLKAALHNSMIQTGTRKADLARN